MVFDHRCTHSADVLIERTALPPAKDSNYLDAVTTVPVAAVAIKTRTKPVMV
jgi:hypothetical protein